MLAEIETTKPPVYSRLSSAAQAQLQQHWTGLLNRLPPPVRAHWQHYQTLRHQHQGKPSFCQAHEELERWIGNRLLRELKTSYPRADSLSWPPRATPGKPPYSVVRALNCHRGLNKYEWHRKMAYLRQYHALRRPGAAEQQQLMAAAYE